MLNAYFDNSGTAWTQVTCWRLWVETTPPPFLKSTLSCISNITSLSTCSVLRLFQICFAPAYGICILSAWVKNDRRSCSGTTPAKQTREKSDGCWRSNTGAPEGRKTHSRYTCNRQTRNRLSNIIFWGRCHRVGVWGVSEWVVLVFGNLSQVLTASWSKMGEGHFMVNMTWVSVLQVMSG